MSRRSAPTRITSWITSSDSSRIWSPSAGRSPGCSASSRMPMCRVCSISPRAGTPRMPHRAAAIASRRRGSSGGRLSRGRAAWRGALDGTASMVRLRTRPSEPGQAAAQPARQAIPDLLAVVATLNERRSGRSDRSADFRALALWFAQAPDDDALHRLWRTAFGVYGSRHLCSMARRSKRARSSRCRHPRPGCRHRHCRSAHSCGAPAAMSVVAAPTVSPAVRRDVAGWRSCAARQTEQTATARARLATGRPTNLGELGELEPDAFGLFLSTAGRRPRGPPTWPARGLHHDRRRHPACPARGARGCCPDRDQEPRRRLPRPRSRVEIDDLAPDQSSAGTTSLDSPPRGGERPVSTSVASA